MKSQFIPYVSKSDNLYNKSITTLKNLSRLFFRELIKRADILLHTIVSFSLPAMLSMSSKVGRRDTTHQLTPSTKRNYMLKETRVASGNQNDSERHQYDLTSIEHKLKKLDKDFYDPFVMYLEGYKGYEIAQYLQISERIIKKRINSVRKQFAKELNKE